MKTKALLLLTTLLFSTQIAWSQGPDTDERRKEHFPGIVQVENIRPPHNTTLRFYNEEGALQKKLEQV